MGTCSHAVIPRSAKEERHVRQLQNRSREPQRRWLIDVTLWWCPEEDSIAVEVLHFASESSFELAVERDRALDAFYHPFAYAARRSPELLDVAA